MVIMGLLSWWYGAGWRLQVTRLSERLAAVMDYFSIDLLLKTLFQPFRQISAGQVNGPIGVQLRAFADRLISRIIGGFIRSFMVVFGGIVIVMTLIVGLVIVAMWAIVPLLPVVGIMLAMSGWLPWM